MNFLKRFFLKYSIRGWVRSEHWPQGKKLEDCMPESYQKKLAKLPEAFQVEVRELFTAFQEHRMLTPKEQAEKMMAKLYEGDENNDEPDELDELEEEVFFWEDVREDEPGSI